MPTLQCTLRRMKQKVRDIVVQHGVTWREDASHVPAPLSPRRQRAQWTWTPEQLTVGTTRDLIGSPETSFTDSAVSYGAPEIPYEPLRIRLLQKRNSKHAWNDCNAYEQLPRTTTPARSSKFSSSRLRPSLTFGAPPDISLHIPRIINP